MDRPAHPDRDTHTTPAGAEFWYEYATAIDEALVGWVDDLTDDIANLPYPERLKFTALRDEAERDITKLAALVKYAHDDPRVLVAVRLIAIDIAHLAAYLAPEFELHVMNNPPNPARSKQSATADVEPDAPQA